VVLLYLYFSFNYTLKSYAKQHGSVPKFSHPQGLYYLTRDMQNVT